VEYGGNGGFRNRWELTAPESYALLYGPKDARQIFKLALLELVARGHLELAETEEPGRFGRSRKAVVLRHGANRERPESRSLADVLTLFTGAVARPVGGRQTEMPVPELARSARTRYGSFEDYVETQVMPGLKRRNLFERRMRRRLGIFKTTRWEPTYAGEAAKAELAGSMTLGEEKFAEWVDREPSQALQFLGLAGSSVLLMPPLHPDIQRLRENPQYRHRDDWYAAGYVPVVGSGMAEDAPDTEGAEDIGDPGALDLDALSLDPGGLGDATSAIDSGMDSGGGGFWSGDGGWGGDGGGGWGGDGGGGFGGGGDGGGGGGGS
jgi:hypothetical protein